MKKALNILALLFVFASFGFPSQVSATLMLETYDSGDPTPEIINGYTMVDVDGSSLGFSDKDDFPVLMNLSTADSEDWWVNGESSDYDIYTTSLYLIKITLPENTFAFSFNVGANKTANAWLTAEETYPDGTRGPGINPKVDFGLSTINTPGFGIYADNRNGSCSHISSVTIDPYLVWGFGNFSISQGDCATVPEPSIIALFAAGLFGLGFARRRQQS